MPLPRDILVFESLILVCKSETFESDSSSIVCLPNGCMAVATLQFDVRAFFIREKRGLFQILAISFCAWRDAIPIATPTIKHPIHRGRQSTQSISFLFEISCGSE